MSWVDLIVFPTNEVDEKRPFWYMDSNQELSILQKCQIFLACMEQANPGLGCFISFVVEDYTKVSICHSQSEVGNFTYFC